MHPWKHACVCPWKNYCRRPCERPFFRQMGDDEVAIEINLGELATRWKLVSLNLADDPDIFRNMNEMSGNQNPYTTIFSLLELVDYR